MPPKSNPTSFGLKLVQRLKTAIGDRNQLCITHRLLVDAQDGRTPLTFTVDIFREPKGMFVATCWQLPLVLVAGETEDEALAKAETDIRLLLTARDTPPTSERRSPRSRRSGKGETGERTMKDEIDLTWEPGGGAGQPVVARVPDGPEYFVRADGRGCFVLFVFARHCAATPIEVPGTGWDQPYESQEAAQSAANAIARSKRLTPPEPPGRTPP
ncbi:hypothetical protein Rumeso_02628 [Rubellimicrobium mesophilum DSM 19309]|uniref:Uncharacterized protein n=2 Tax=Rubellimicrobium TaxID=295418 RepID=A0A017HN93_9RHOB|nr:hypothetical protein Rumeso_02628 [Rubellimicrobium mesophilum DSM 19309]